MYVCVHNNFWEIFHCKIEKDTLFTIYIIYIYIHIYIYIYIYERENSVCMCYTITVKQKTQRLCDEFSYSFNT